MAEGRQQIAMAVRRTLEGSDSLEELDNAIANIQQASVLSLDDRDALLIGCWEKAVHHYLEDGILDVDEEKKLAEFKEHFSLSESALDRNGALTQIVKAAVLREVLSGVIPERMHVNGNLPINLQKGESLVWAFPGSDYLEDKTRRRYVGSSRGVSVRIMKGVYYRVGAFQGQSITDIERVHVDTGCVFVTKKNIYFYGPQKSLRLPYTKIVSFQPFSDGLGVMRDAATAKPQFFITGDGWFTYNLVTNLSQIQ